jgi:hypothetical protein
MYLLMLHLVDRLQDILDALHGVFDDDEDYSEVVERLDWIINQLKRMEEML